MGLGTDDGDEYFCSLKVHRLVTQIQHRTVVPFDIARLPLLKSEVTRFFNDIHDTVGFLHGTYSRRFRYFM